MTYLDKILQLIVSSSDRMSSVPAKAANTLRSLASSASSDIFITENQSKLAIKLLQENLHLFGADVRTQVSDALQAPMWSRAFRHIEQVKKMYIRRDNDTDPYIVIDFTFSAHLRKVITQANKDIENLVQETNGKSYIATLTERNIVTLVDLLRPLNFDIDETIIDYYNTIKSWSVDDVRNNFLIDTMASKNFHKCIAEDLGVDTPIDDNIISDRGVRYRYFSKELPDDGTLTRKIATRTRTKIWINSAEHTMNDVVKSLVDLKRLPVMFVFDSFNQSNNHELMETISEALKSNNLDDKVGIYFRLPNTDNGSKFNDIISSNKYNQYLDRDTNVVGVQSGKIPKFFLNNPWKPMSVVAVESPLRSSKTAVYASCCDLIISYSGTEPFIENQEKWQ